MIELKVTHKSIKKPKDIVKAFENLVEASVACPESVTIKSATNGNHLGYGLVLIDIDKKDDFTVDDYKLLAETADKVVKVLYGNDDIKIVEVFVLCQEQLNKEETEYFMYNYCKLGLKEKDGYLEIKR